MSYPWVPITLNACVRLVDNKGKEVKSFTLSNKSNLDFNTVMGYNESKYYFKEKILNLHNGEMFIIYEAKPDSIPGEVLSPEYL